MCNRYRMSARQAELGARYGIVGFPPDETFPPGELFPKKPAYVVREDEGARMLDVMTWGFPHQVRGASGKMLDKPVTNVRNLASPLWRSALANPARRCLVPVTSFSEYGQVRSEDDGKLPLHWFDVPSRPIFSFAGIWRPTEQGRAYAFLTTEPNAIVATIHPKAMPVILHVEDEQRWLTEPWDSACEMVSPYPTQLMAVTGHGHSLDSLAAAGDEEG